MPYSDQDHDRALARLMADIDRTPTKPQGTTGIALCLVLLMFMLGLLVLLTACNTVAGVAADVEAAARGTQEYMARDPQAP